MMRIRFGSALLVGLMAMVVGNVAAQDTVALKKAGRGSNAIGDIVKITADGIDVSTNSRTRTMPTNEIRRVSFASEPGELRSARSAVISGQFEQAVAALNQIKPDDRDSKFIRQEIEFYKAFSAAQLAIRGTGDLKRAAQAVSAFSKANRDSYHYYESKKLLGDLAMSFGSFEGAGKYYAQYAKAPFPDYKMEGNILAAYALQAGGDLQNAEKKFNEVVGSSSDDADATRYKNLAKIGIASCLAARGEGKTAIESAQAIIAENDPSDVELFSRAYNALGAAHQATGNTVDAVLAYLHVDVLFFNQRNEHAEALYHLSKLWNEMNKPDRAVEARKTLTQRYGGTVWAKRS